MSRSLQLCCIGLISAAGLLQGAVAPTTATIGVTVSPNPVNVRLGSTRTFTARVTGSSNTAVDWYVNTTKGGNATVGTIDTNGVYTPPAVVPTPNTVTVKAVSQADVTKSGTSAVTVLNSVPTITSLDPSSININLPTSVTVNGTNFMSTSKVQLNGAAVTTTFVSSTKLTFSITSSAAVGTTIPVVVLTPDPGSAQSTARNLTVVAPVSVTVSPTSKTLRGGVEEDFSVSVKNNENKSVTWYVNNIAGGNDTLGKIDSTGKYIAPVILPNPASVTIKAVSVADPTASATSAVTLQNPIPVITSADQSSLKIGTITVNLTGTGFASAAVVKLGNTSLQTTWISSTKLKAVGLLDPPLGGFAVFTVMNPDPGGATSNALALPVQPGSVYMSYSAAARFLSQATFGPTPASIAHLQQIGIDAWFAEQFAKPSSTFPEPLNQMESDSRLQKAWVYNAVQGDDQLRQRLAFALGQIFVVSGVTDGRFWQLAPYEQLLYDNAFGNYRDLMNKVTLSPSMGIYLNMVNNDKPNPKKNTAANENYARELMQLFTVGEYLLNGDGTRQQPQTPTYKQFDVTQMALVNTGWTYPATPGFQSHWTNEPYYTGDMVAFEDHHDTTDKVVLGQPIIAPHTAENDLKQALDIIFAHQNVGPFVSYRLIQHLVTSNPSPAYVAAVAAVFNNNGQGVKGDLMAVVRKVLTYTEAGNDSAQSKTVLTNPPPAPTLAPGAGHLLEPALFTISLLRALEATVTVEPGLTGQMNNMGQNILFSPSVFNYYSPFYRIPGSGLPAPEFQLLNPSTSIARINFVYHLLNNTISSTIKVDLTPFTEVAGTPNTLVNAVDMALTRGQMDPALRTNILAAIAATTDNRTRARNALYLAAASNFYQVER